MQQMALIGNLLDDLENFRTTSFTIFLHYLLELVDAVPKRAYPPPPDLVQRDLELCLQSVIAATEDKHNELLMRSIDEALDCYCKGESDFTQLEGLTEATNATLLLLQPLSIGNSRPAADLHSDNFPLFIAHKHPINGNERKPTIVCSTRKHAAEACQTVSQSLEDIASPSESNTNVLKWKHFYNCWEFLHGSEPLNRARPNYNQDYTVSPLTEYRLSNDVGQVDRVGHPLHVKWCAEDAARVFYDTLGRDHIMNVAITDNLLCVWYFDHESPIQTSAFNFVEDFPYFLLFVFALQRFSLADWGLIDQLSPVNDQEIGPLNISEESCIDDDQNNQAMFRRLDHNPDGCPFLSLCGRATHVIFGSVTAGEKDLAAVLKLSWREKARFPEGTFLREATKRLRDKQYLDACKCLPTLLAEKGFPDFSTDIIRQKLMISVNEDTTRLPYFIVLPQYQPITVRTVNWTVFLEDYMSLIHCHFVLWSVGIEHGDISEANLMFDVQTNTPKLCDFDLSHFSDPDRPKVKTTGTRMFVALELLYAASSELKDQTKQLYRHDLESFIAVLIWIIFRYDQGKLYNADGLRQWKSDKSGIARESTFRQLLRLTRPEHIPRAMWFNIAQAGSQSQRIWNESNSLQTRYFSSINDDCPPGIDKEFSPEQQQRLDYLKSIGAITEILPYLVNAGSNSLIIQKISEQIKAHIANGI